MESDQNLIKPDRKQYLRELVEMYDQQLNSKGSFLREISHDLIVRWKQECISELRKIEQVDLEATLLAASSASSFLTTKTNYDSTWMPSAP